MISNGLWLLIYAGTLPAIDAQGEAYIIEGPTREDIFPALGTKKTSVAIRYHRNRGVIAKYTLGGALAVCSSLTCHSRRAKKKRRNIVAGEKMSLFTWEWSFQISQTISHYVGTRHKTWNMVFPGNVCTLFRD